jgi:hypothetical protein
MTLAHNDHNVLEDKYRELVITAGLVALGEKRRPHFARNVIGETIGTLSHCSGSPAAMNGVAGGAASSQAEAVATSMFSELAAKTA